MPSSCCRGHGLRFTFEGHSGQAQPLGRFRPDCKDCGQKSLHTSLQGSHSVGPDLAVWWTCSCTGEVLRAKGRVPGALGWSVGVKGRVPGAVVVV